MSTWFTVENAVSPFVWAALVVGAIGLTAVISFFSMPLGRFLNVVDHPDPAGRKDHAKPTPLVGGLAIMAPTLLVCLVVYISVDSALYAALGVLPLGMLILGLFDDRSHIAPTIRLVVSILMCGAIAFVFPELALEHLTFSFSTLTLGLGVAAVSLTAVCLVGLQNAVNMADGRNGLVIGMAAIWTALIAFYAPAELMPLLAVFGSALVVAFCANWKGRMFLGDSGAYSLSAMVGALAIYTYSVSPTLTADAVVLWFMVPVLDCLRLIWFRSRNGKSPFEGDSDHLHHYMSDFMQWRAGIVVYLLIVATPSIAAVAVPGLTALWLIVAVALYFGGLKLWSAGASEKRAEESDSPMGELVPLPLQTATPSTVEKVLDSPPIDLATSSGAHTGLDDADVKVQKVS